MGSIGSNGSWLLMAPASVYFYTAESVCVCVCVCVCVRRSAGGEMRDKLPPHHPPHILPRPGGVMGTGSPVAYARVQSATPNAPWTETPIINACDMFWLQ